ncbi:DUF3465 domain-containing protein [Salinicola halophilus]|uniref:DUF3465 domain-containing protein n=1 Tax=Salinicola halophilus TaxID=184065 RepID=UPI000DA26660|nr:DUF3465 domain-containing protein [Salinicola halophilus]
MPVTPRKSVSRRPLAFLVVLLCLAGAVTATILSTTSAVSDGVLQADTPEETLRRAFDTRRGDFWVEASGEVIDRLPDDLDGSRHQRMIVRLDTGQTLLIAHNIDIAPRVEGIEAGERLTFRGEYVWNEKGGVIHWTHRDPGLRTPGGWLEWQGRRYR